MGLAENQTQECQDLLNTSEILSQFRRIQGYVVVPTEKPLSSCLCLLAQCLSSGSECAHFVIGT